MVICWQTRHGAVEVAETTISGSAGSRKIKSLGLAFALETPKPNPSDKLLPTRPHFQIVPLSMGPWGPNSLKSQQTCEKQCMGTETGQRIFVH